MRYAILLSYQGTHYRGWQRQPNVVSVQETVEKALSKVLKKEITIVGCGRTDSGVHAHNYVAHFDFSGTWDYNLVYRVNKVLDRDIVLHHIREVDKTFHAQYDAVERMYYYRFHTIDNPFINSFSTFIEVDELDNSLMLEALKLVLKYDDFKAFCKNPDLYKTTICHMVDADLFLGPKGQYSFKFSANRFLRSMIRILAYRVLKIGQKQLSIDQFERFFIEKAPLKSNDFAYPQGLSFAGATYKNLDLGQVQSTAFLNSPVWRNFE